MKGIGAVLLAAGAAFAAAGGSEPAAADSLESQLLRFEAVTALGGTSVFKYEHLVPAATDVSTLPATTGVPVKNMLTTCANDVESLCQRTFGNDIASENSRADAVKKGLNCLHDNFPRVSVECIHATHTAAEAVAANGLQSQLAVLSAKADAAMTAADAACPAERIETACSQTPSAPPAQPSRESHMEHMKPGRGKGKGMGKGMPGRHGKRALRKMEREGHHGPPAPPSPQQAAEWFNSATALQDGDVSNIGGSMEAASACLASMATPPPPRDSWFGHWHSGPPTPPAGSADACTDAANAWLRASAAGVSVQAAADAAPADAAVTTPRSPPPSQDMSLDGWAVEGVEEPQPCPMWGCDNEEGPHWHRRHHWDDEDDEDGEGVWIAVGLIALLSFCACRARRRCRRRGGEGYWPSPREMRAGHQAAVPTPQAATAAAVAAAAPEAAVPQYHYGATAAPVAAPTVPGGLYPDMPPTPSRWSLANVFGRSSAPPAAAVGYAPVYTTEH